MEDYEDQNAIRGYGDPISFKRLEELIKKAENVTCKIYCMGGKTATGFFFVCVIKMKKNIFL